MRTKENIVSFNTCPTQCGEIECTRDGAVYAEQPSASFIQGGSRMREAARTVLCGGRSAMVVPTATLTSSSLSASVTRFTNSPRYILPE